jgi:hypothetical protein
MRNLRLLVACTAIFALAFAAGCGDDDGGTTTETNCTDGQDNDGDQLTDCADPDCVAHPSCVYNNNGVCEPLRGENTTNCLADCPANPVCGNGTCETGEDATNCPADCGANPCNNDGTCDAGETVANCPADCGGTGQCTTDADILAQNGCAGQACDLNADGTAAECRATGTAAHYGSCTTSTDCMAGDGCISTDGGVTANCLPYCIPGGTPTCPGAGVCGATVENHPTLGLCLEGDNCDPMAQTGCGTGEACYLLNSAGDTMCGTAGAGAQGTSCEYLNDCAGGLLCYGNPGTSTCEPLCDGSHACTTGTCADLGITAWPGLGVCQ